jgi:hypothetical protein
MKARAALALAGWLCVASTASALAAAPTVTSRVSGNVGAEGWFVGSVTVSWEISGTLTAPFPGPDCDTRILTADTKGTVLSCTAHNDTSTVTERTEPIRIDRTPPAGVSATASRPPDANGWYLAPVALAWAGKDPTSDIASCTTSTYTGPDGPSVAPVGTCTDHAGNSSAPAAFPLSFDVTPPGLSGVGATISGKTATLRWAPAVDVASTTLTRQDGAVVDVPAGAREASSGPLSPGAYTWTVTVRDAAGNATSATASATVPDPAVVAKAAAAARLTLRWKAGANAKYYNLQLFRAGRKVLTAWPTKPQYRLPRTWRLNGRTHRLAAGTYRWYAWPGYGPRARRSYGRLLAQGKVKVTAAAVRAAYR